MSASTTSFVYRCGILIQVLPLPLVGCDDAHSEKLLTLAADSNSSILNFDLSF